ncbi:MAG: CHAT domain-containing protein, partial [Bacteroidales bacterium]|nr:CHAT domain-containing protein [Bacteroidales bacterium]
KKLILQIQQQLKADEAMLEYFMTDSFIYCFTVQKGGADLIRSKIEPDFKDKIIDYIACIKKHRFNEFQDKSIYLYNNLIKPVRKSILNKTKLIIIPDGQLLYLPFGSFISKKQNTANNIDFSKLDYLIKDYEIVTQYSANLWLESIQYTQKDNLGNGFLGLAPFSDSTSLFLKIDSTNLSFLDRSLPEDVINSLVNNHEYKPLPYSGKEVNEIAQLFESQGINTKNLFGTNATEQKLKNNSKHNKYLHIATHGIINNIHPELSGLAFVKDNSEIPNKKVLEDWQIEQNADGILYAKEIYDLDLNAELVVLSACESGIGKLEKGEGIMSLTRGFLYNKVPNIVFSLWKINDKDACTLMIKFYENILKGKSYSLALRNAKLDMINDKETAFPSNWAAFSLIGN